MLFPDIIFSSQVMDIAEEYTQVSDKRCSHCHRKIVGRVHQIGNRYYDDYCWQFRFINEGSIENNEKFKEQIIRKGLELP